MHRPGVELAIFRSLVRRPTTAIPSHPSLRVPNECTKFHQNRVKIANVGEAIDRETDRQTDAGDILSLVREMGQIKVVPYIALAVSIAHRRTMKL